jgi:hypothetical protein
MATGFEVSAFFGVLECIGLALKKNLQIPSHRH